MPSTFSKYLSCEQFRKLAFLLAEKLSADVLLGSPSFSDACMSYAGIDPVSELVLDADCVAADIGPAVKEFSFADDTYTIGYFSYECGHLLRGVSSSKKREYPALHLKKYRSVISYDGSRGMLEFSGCDEKFIDSLISEAVNSDLPDHYNCPSFSAESVSMSLNREEYESGVAKTLEYIRDGLTYQLNLSTRFNLPASDLDPVRWFFALNEKYPAPYYALFHSGGKVIVSTSPELFLKVEKGKVLSEPIKGTAHFDEYSEELVDKLRSSVKEDAELSMIVDLVRNDISSNCCYGSVVVEEHKSVFAVDNLLQMFSRVRGVLAEESDCVDLLLDAFPGGSITGCPKKSSMELIEALEPHSRGAYCGSMVLIKSPQDLISSIAIRTAVYDSNDHSMSYWSGSGIVIDSEPHAEYLETMAKAGKIIEPEGM